MCDRTLKNLTDRSLQALGRLKHLESLSLGYSAHFTKAGLQLLLKSCPKLGGGRDKRGKYGNTIDGGSIESICQGSAEVFDELDEFSDEE